MAILSHREGDERREVGKIKKVRDLKSLKYSINYELEGKFVCNGSLII